MPVVFYHSVIHGVGFLFVNEYPQPQRFINIKGRATFDGWEEFNPFDPEKKLFCIQLYCPEFRAN